MNVYHSRKSIDNPKTELQHSSDQRSVGPRKLARLLVFALERAKNADIQAHAGGGKAPGQPSESSRREDELPMSSPESNDSDQITPLALPHRPAEGFSSAVKSPTNGRSAIHDASHGHSGPSDTPKQQYFGAQSPPDREEHVPFLIVDDNAINMKVRSCLSPRHGIGSPY